MSEKSSYRVRLMRWGDSSSSGRTVTLKLPDDTEDHPFKGLSVGARNGQLMEMEISLVEGDLQLKTLTPSSEKRSDPQSALPTKQATSAPASSASPASDGGRTGAGQGTPDTTAGDPPSDDVSTPSAAGAGSDAPPERPGPGASQDDYDAFASQMGHAAESLAAVAEEMGKAVDDTDELESDDDAPAPLTAGQQAVVRAVDLCKSIDYKRAGFFYFMMSRYPSVPNLPADSAGWSRDAKVTRDRVCHHCDLNALDTIAEDKSARQRFEALEKEFERSERMR